MFDTIMNTLRIHYDLPLIIMVSVHSSESGRNGELNVGVAANETVEDSSHTIMIIAEDCNDDENQHPTFVVRPSFFFYLCVFHIYTLQCSPQD